jgi:parvulin-like peptidyl-prolyl isomerase
MPAAEKKQLLASLIREEALYREALSWGLDKEDYVIRRRLVQSLEFSLGGDATVPGALNDRALRDYFAANRDRYAEPPTVTFTHVFFSFGEGGRERARLRAEQALRALNARRRDAGSTGDRFLYHVNYAHQGLDMIRSHFGDEMAAQLFALEPGEEWRGPFVSPYGLHLVRLSGSSAGGVPAFESIRDLVARDAAQAAVRERQQRALDRIVAGYRVDLSSDLEDLR